jgi:hypothetical protein
MREIWTLARSVEYAENKAVMDAESIRGSEWKRRGKECGWQG